MQKPVKNDGSFNFYKCSRCSSLFTSSLIEVDDKAVCIKCVQADEWLCDACHKAIPEFTPFISVDSAFAICPECDANFEEEGKIEEEERLQRKLKEMEDYQKSLKSFTLKWVHHSGCMMEYTIDKAESKEHALSKAMGDPICNIYLIDYMDQFHGNMFSVDNFLWDVNGRIG